MNSILINVGELDPVKTSIGSRSRYTNSEGARASSGKKALKPALRSRDLVSRAFFEKAGAESQ